MAGKYYFQTEVRHKGLNKYRVVKAGSRYELNQKAEALKAQWDEQWDKKSAAEEKKAEREKILSNHDESLKYANEMTMEAEKAQEDLDSILLNSLYPRPLDGNMLKDFSDYSIKSPKMPATPVLPKEPQQIDDKYNPKVPFLIKLSKKKYEVFKNNNENNFKNDLTK